MQVDKNNHVAIDVKKYNYHINYTKLNNEDNESFLDRCIPESMIQNISARNITDNIKKIIIISPNEDRKTHININNKRFILEAKLVFIFTDNGHIISIEGICRLFKSPVLNIDIKKCEHAIIVYKFVMGGVHKQFRIIESENLFSDEFYRYYMKKITINNKVTTINMYHIPDTDIHICCSMYEDDNCIFLTEEVSEKISLMGYDCLPEEKFKKLMEYNADIEMTIYFINLLLKN